MKYITLFFLFFAIQLSAQKTHQQWTVELKKISDCEYDVVFNVKIDKGWHIYSIVKSDDKGGGAPNPTEIKFDKSAGIELVGKMSESKPHTELDSMFNTIVRTHENTVVFKQRIKVTSKGPHKISGNYQADECKDDVGCRVPPPKKFEVLIEASKRTCK